MYRYLIMLDNAKYDTDGELIISFIIEGYYRECINNKECDYLLSKCVSKFSKKMVDSIINRHNILADKDSKYKDSKENL